MAIEKKAGEFELLIHANIQYDAQDGEDKYMVGYSTGWITKAEFLEIVKASDLGVLRVRLEARK